MTQENAAMMMQPPPIPEHVPPELVVDFNYNTNPGMFVDPFATIAKLHDGPRIVFIPMDVAGRPTWLLTRGEDMRTVLWDQQTFSSKGKTGFSALLGESWDLIPLEVDHEEHTKFRNLLNPLFAPRQIDKLEQGMRQTAIQLIGRFADSKGCEFMQAFGRPFPVTVFMQLMGLPLEQTPTFLKWEDELLHSGDFGVMARAAGEIAQYLRDLAVDRKKNPLDDLASFVANAQIDGRALPDDEILGIYYLLFVGGLDTVAASLGFMFRYLATHPDDQEKLRKHPEMRADAIEELLRAFSVVNSSRLCTRDVELGGVQMKKGDRVLFSYSMAGLDPEDFPDPFDIKLDRSPNRHMAFAFGPHRCIGSHLARREFRVAFDELFDRLPPFRIKAGTTPVVHGASVFGVDRLELEWD